jgi:hypothetical protein
MLVLAETLAAQVDGAVAGGQPGYVVAKMCSSYAGVLELLTQLTGSAGDTPFDRFIESLSQPSFGARDEAFRLD